MIASFASHSRAALSAIASSIGWRSVGELPITRRISLVAVCCSRACCNSLEVAFSRSKDAVSCWRSSAYVGRWVTADAFTRLRGFALWVLELFLVAIIEQRQLLSAGKLAYPTLVHQASPAAELIFTSGGSLGQR